MASASSRTASAPSGLNNRVAPAQREMRDAEEMVVSDSNHGVVDFGGRGNISALKVKAFAIRLRHKVHGLKSERDKNAGTYSTLRGSAPPNGSSSNCAGLMSILYHPFSLFLVALPLGVYSHFAGWGALATFWLNILAMIPLAKILGDGTEELAAAIKNDTISGLLNATLGNAVEMILSVQTLRKGLLDVVKATLLGSILSNILLVLGTSFLLGGLIGSSTPYGRHHIIHIENYQATSCTMEKEQMFSSKSALVNMAMQLLACMTCALPTVFASASSGVHSTPEERHKVVEVSRVGACIIMSSYVAYIMFQLVTHKKMLTIDEGNDSDDDDEEGGGEEDTGLSAPAALTLMAVTTCLIAISSEMLVGAIEHVVEHCGIPARFIGIILLPFAGNACEHASAIRFAMQDRPGLSIGIAVGSSTQIALFVVPFTVVAGWGLGQEMDLVFGAMNTAVMILSVLVVLTLVIDGRSNWLKGFMLCTAYVFCAVLYWYMPPPLE
mmetsp:Transcript_30816/g.89577  ORF Transcript_30816/g.89577 Transcript_30816/m.89577 type:complete len:497 (-) Transcript_30816:80-1570(-)